MRLILKIGIQGAEGESFIYCVSPQVRLQFIELRSGESLASQDMM
jgi:hypothetical protein